MAESWRRIRALNYGTAGRTIRGTVRRLDDDSIARFWSDPPSRYREDGPNGIRFIDNPQGKYRQGPDGMVFTAHNSGVWVAYGGFPTRSLLGGPDQYWPMVGARDGYGLGAPAAITETDVSGRPGWQIEFAASHMSSAQTFVIDAETGFITRWYTPSDPGLEVLEHHLDEQFDEDLFVWAGEYIEHDDETALIIAREEEKQRRLADIPRPEPTWFPTGLEMQVSDGDPDTGAIAMNVHPTGPGVILRQWIAGTDDPLSDYSSHLVGLVETVDETWVRQLRYDPDKLGEGEARRILDSVPPVSPVRDAAEVVAERNAAQEQRDREVSSPGTVGTTGEIYSGPVPVAYMQFYLSSIADYTDDVPALAADLNPGNGLVDTRSAPIKFTTGLHTGSVGVTVELADARPDVDTSWEEIVESPLAVDAPLMLTGWGSSEPAVDLPLSPGTYRLRYSGTNLDAARDADTGGRVDSYQIIIWPSALTDGEVIKQTSGTAASWHRHAANDDRDR